jgi:hypothetical protein
MADLYFACDWVIRSYAPLKRLGEVATDLNCGLVFLGHDYKSNDGFATQTFAVRVSAESVLIHFVEAIGSEMGFSEWYPIAAQDYDKGIPFSDVEPGSIEWGKMNDTYTMLGGYNEQAKRGI